MLGIMYKDFCVLKKTLLGNFIAIFFASAWCLVPWNNALDGLDNQSIGMGMAFFVAPILTYIIILSVLSSFGQEIIVHDENKYYSAFISATPLTAKGHVRSKYYEMLIISSFILIWGFILDKLIGFVNSERGSSKLIYVSFFFLLIISKSIETPFLIRCGTKVGKMVKIIIALGIIYIVMIYALFGPLPRFNQDKLIEDAIVWFVTDKKLPWSNTQIIAVASGISFVFYYISYKISCKLYQKGVNTYDM